MTSRERAERLMGPRDGGETDAATLEEIRRAFVREFDEARAEGWAEGVAAERERCAKIADQYHRIDKPGEIGAAIREGTA